MTLISRLKNKAFAQLKQIQQKPQTTVCSSELLTQKVFAELTVVFVLTNTFIINYFYLNCDYIYATP